MTGDDSKMATVRRRAVRRAGPPVGGSATESASTLVDTSVLVSDAGRRRREPRKSANSAAALAESAAWFAQEVGTGSSNSDAQPKRAVTDAASPELDSPESDTDSSEAKNAQELSSEQSPARKLGWLDWAAAVVAVLSVVALLAASALFVHHQRHADALRERRAEYLQVAKQAAIDVTSIQDVTAAQDIDLVLSVTSGELRDEYSSLHEKYAQFARDAKIKAHGEIVAAAIESDDANAAQVLVAVKETLTNAGSADPQQRMFRLRLTLNRAGNGPVTASRLEFVP